jgi:hypothetical protein
MFHTAYNSFETKPNGRDYIGKHSSEDPYDNYLGTFKDKSFDPNAKIIMAYSKTPEGALWFEINFHNVFNVSQNPQFANRSKQTSTKFDTTGQTGLREYAPWSQEEKDLISARTREAMQSNQVRKNLEKANADPKVRENRRKSKTGIPRDLDTKKKIQLTLTGYKQTPEHIANAAKNRKGCRWWVNSNNERKFQRESPGTEWQPGQTWKPLPQ